MEFVTAFLDIVLHLDAHLVLLIKTYGNWVYLILFLIIFCETGLVVTPFLPGDSLLFVAGTLAAGGAMEVQALSPLLMTAAFGGDNANYWIGRYVGPKVFSREEARFLNHAHLEKTHLFYERHGGKTVLIARFLPIFRTFAPFVAGIGKMDYRRFLAFSFLGSVCWIGSFVLGGYYFGNIPAIKQNLTLVIMGIIVLSILPGTIQFLRSRLRNSSAQ